MDGGEVDRTLHLKNRLAEGQGFAEGFRLEEEDADARGAVGKGALRGLGAEFAELLLLPLGEEVEGVLAPSGAGAELLEGLEESGRDVVAPKLGVLPVAEEVDRAGKERPLRIIDVMQG